MNSPSWFTRLIRRIGKAIAWLFFLDQWMILTSNAADADPLQWSAFQPIVPWADRYWADPFPVRRDDRNYIFIEEKMYARRRGHIACLMVDEQGGLQSQQVVLERPYHLSYPFVFEHRGEMYMLPETAQNRTLEAYRCVRFPDRWELAATLMRGIYAVDATLLEYQNQWWLFANVKEKGGSSLDALYLFHSDNPLSSQWTPHPRNPIVHDIRSARPAGRIFLRGGELIRPSQDNSRRYGYAINFNRIVKLSETEYEEVTETHFEPPRRTKILATHTFNRSEGLTVIDAVIRRWKFSSR